METQVSSIEVQLSATHEPANRHEAVDCRIAAISSALVVFGRLHDDPIHTRRRQAFEKRQWTKSREVGRLRCGGLYAGSIGMRTPMRSVERRVDGVAAPEPASAHNPSLLAQILSK